MRDGCDPPMHLPANLLQGVFAIHCHVMHVCPFPRSLIEPKATDGKATDASGTDDGKLAINAIFIKDINENDTPQDQLESIFNQIYNNVIPGFAKNELQTPMLWDLN